MRKPKSALRFHAGEAPFPSGVSSALPMPQRFRPHVSIRFPFSFPESAHSFPVSCPRGENGKHSLPMTSTTSPSLDLERLENVRNHPGKITARCPACAEEERDRTGNNLVRFDGGAFSCVSDPEHTKRIFELVGIKSEAPRLSREEWIKRKRDDGDRQRRERERHDIAACVRRKRETIVNGWRWNTEDVWEDSPTRPTSAIDDPRILITSLFDPEAIVWTGETKQSGEHCEERWRTVPECFESPVEEI